LLADKINRQLEIGNRQYPWMAGRPRLLSTRKATPTRQARARRFNHRKANATRCCWPRFQIRSVHAE